MILLAPLYAWLLMLLLGALHAQPEAEIVPAFGYLVSFLITLGVQLGAQMGRVAG